MAMLLLSPVDSVSTRRRGHSIIITRITRTRTHTSISIINIIRIISTSTSTPIRLLRPMLRLEPVESALPWGT